MNTMEYVQQGHRHPQQLNFLTPATARPDDEVTEHFASHSYEEIGNLEVKHTVQMLGFDNKPRPTTRALLIAPAQ